MSPASPESDAAPALPSTPDDARLNNRKITMDFTPRPLAFSSAALNGLSERLVASHHTNNYTGAVTRLNAIRTQLQALDFASAKVFQLNGLKREELLAWNVHDHIIGRIAELRPIGFRAQLLRMGADRRDMGAEARLALLVIDLMVIAYLVFIRYGMTGWALPRTTMPSSLTV